MTRHPFIPYDKIKDCAQCALFGPICAGCSTLISTCRECDGGKKILDHILHEKCQGTCDSVRDCTYYEKVDKVLCTTCASYLVRAQLGLVEREKHDLTLISSDKDFHNALIMSDKELRDGIDGDDSIPAGEKAFAHHKLLAERIGHLKVALFEKEKEIGKLRFEKSFHERTIRDYGNEVRKEIQEQLKVQDALYQPVVKPVPKPRATAASKKSPFDRMAESYAAANKGMSLEEARRILQKGMAS